MSLMSLLRQFCQNGFQLLLRVFSGRFQSPTSKDLVRVMPVMMVMMTVFVMMVVMVFMLILILVIIVMMVVMEAVWFVSGLLAGAQVNADLLDFTLMTAFAMFSFCAFMTFLQMVIRTTAACAGTGVVLFYALFFMGLVGNYLFSFQGDKMITKILLFILNASPVGEWFLHSYLGSPEPNDFGYTMSYGLVPHLILCIVFAALFTIIGIRSLKRKDLK